MDLGPYTYPTFAILGNTLIPKLSPMKPGEKLAVKSSPVKVGMKRKAADETPGVTKVSKNSSAGHRPASLAQGLEIQAPMCECEKLSLLVWGKTPGAPSLPILGR